MNRKRKQKRKDQLGWYFCRLGVLITAWLGLSGVSSGQPVILGNMAQKELHLENQRGEPLDTHNRNVYGYDQGNRREPFNSLLGPLTQDIPSPRLSGSPEKNKEHWRLLGIVAGKNGYRAMIESSETNRHIVAPGKRVGTKGWKVKQIKEDRLILEKPPESRSGQTKGLSILTLTFPD